VGTPRFRELTHCATLRSFLVERDRLASDRTLSQNSAMVLLTISTYASKVSIGETPKPQRGVALAPEDQVGAYNEKQTHYSVVS
jgi:hypothetical protein